MKEFGEFLVLTGVFWVQAAWLLHQHLQRKKASRLLVVHYPGYL